MDASINNNKMKGRNSPIFRVACLFIACIGILKNSALQPSDQNADLPYMTFGCLTKNILNLSSP
jgi:hypothetical protein